MCTTSTRIILTAAIFANVLQLGDGGRCYSLCQQQCHIPIDKLWDANYRQQNTGVCKYFEELHSCTMAFQKECKFSTVDSELYKTDIINTYTKPPYGCALLGGNMEMQAGNDKKTSNIAAWVSANGRVLIVTLFIVYLIS